MSHIGSNIARLRGFKRLTQKEIAGKLNMSQQDYSKIENSEHVSDEVLELVASVLEVPTEIIKQLDQSSAISINQQGGNTGTMFFQMSSEDKIAELYDRLIKEKDEIIKMQKEVIETYRQQQKVS